MGPLQGSISALTATVVATADIKSKQLVGLGGAPAGNGERVFGVAQTDAREAQAVAVDVITIADLACATPINAGDAFQSNADGAPIPLAGGVEVGVALTTAANPGDLFTALIK